MNEKKLEIVLASPRGFCAGVDRAILIVEKALQKKEAAFIWDTAAEVFWKSGKTDAAKNAAQNALLLAEKGEGTSNHHGIEYYHRQLKKFSETVFAP